RVVARGGRGLGRAQLQRAARLVLPRARVAGRGAVTEWRRARRREGLSRRPQREPAQRPFALRPGGKPEGARQTRRGRSCRGRVQSGLEERRSSAQGGEFLTTDIERRRLLRRLSSTPRALP